MNEFLVIHVGMSMKLDKNQDNLKQIASLVQYAFFEK